MQDVVIDSEISSLEEKLGYRFKDKTFLIQALTHSSAKFGGNYVICNERLEFLGDSILGHIVAEYLFTNFPDKQEGELSMIKSLLVSSKTLAMLAKRLGFDKLIILGRGLKAKKVLPRSILCNTFESMIAAIYLDGGMDAVRTFILKNLETKIEDIRNNDYEKNYKSLLQDYAQRQLTILPTYRVTSEAGPDHHKTFQVVVELQDKSFGPASGMNKKEAEQGAARLALQTLGLISD
ncbi:MAG: ribonuclease III [Planctomycetes bacterium RBG_16_43_13]|nr:MAG: ribonuclease III [Planctomycetes bacterium RBG_16_43_13]